MESSPHLRPHRKTGAEIPTRPPHLVDTLNSGIQSLITRRGGSVVMASEKRCPICEKVIEPIMSKHSNPQAEILLGAYAVHLRTQHPRFYRWRWWYRTASVLIPLLGVTIILIAFQTGSLTFFIVSVLIPAALGFFLVRLNRTKTVTFRVQWSTNPTQVASDLPWSTPSPLNQCKLCGVIFPLVDGRPEGLPDHYRTSHPEHHRWEQRAAIASMSSLIIFALVIAISYSSAKPFALIAIVMYSAFVVGFAAVVLKTEKKFRRMWAEKHG